MSRKAETKLVKAYKKYRILNRKNVAGFLRSFMSEIIFRTTRLEGEKISRATLSSLFK